MKKIKLLATSLLLALPFLMGNSPAPYPMPTEYTDYTSTAIVETHDGVSNHYVYTTTITNTGNGFLDLSKTTLRDGEEYATGTSLYRGIYLIKDEAREIAFRTGEKVNTPTLYVVGLTEPVTGITYKNITNLTKEATRIRTLEGNTVYRYAYEVEVEGVDPMYTYQTVTTWKYGSNTYTAGLDNVLYEFYSDIDMVVEDIEITNITFFQGRKNPISNFIGNIINIFMIGFAILLLAIVVPIIIIVVVLVVRKKKKQAV